MHPPGPDKHWAPGTPQLCVLQPIPPGNPMAGPAPAMAQQGQPAAPCPLHPGAAGSSCALTAGKLKRMQTRTSPADFFSLGARSDTALLDNDTQRNAAVVT